MELTYFGQSCVQLEVGGKTLLFDPFISPNDLARHVDVSRLKPDYLLISHGHQDHIADAEQVLRQSGAKLISNFEIVQWFGEQGFDNAHPMNHGGQWDFEFGKVKYVNAIHSSTLPDGSSGGNPGGFVIETPEGTIYYAGDTALTMDMKLIPEFFNLDLALLPVGDNFTMGIDEAIKAADFVQCSQVLGIHYDTFGFIQIDHADAQQRFQAFGKDLHLLPIGESMQVGQEEAISY